MVRSDSFIIILWENFDTDFIFFQFFDVGLTFVLISIKDNADISIISYCFDSRFVEP